MKPEKLKNLFLNQSYEDAWTEYEKSLKKRFFIHWDYVILTASNEDQAKAFEAQIRFRKEQKLLPEQTVYAVLPDPDGKRVGSGGATFHVMKYIREHSDSADCFKDKRILVIHSGGDSKRVPQYSACGKLFSPVPRELPDGRRSTLFDEFIISMSGMPSRFKEGMLILSGDVLLLFNPLQIDFQFHGAAAISIKEHVETGKNHGVFLGNEKGYVKRFLHKMSVEALKEAGAVNAQENVDIDTGAIMLDPALLNAMLALVCTDGRIDAVKFDRFVNEKARISFYGDFLYPLASDATLEQYLKEKPEGSYCTELEECRKVLWEVLRPFSLRLLCLSPAQFIHFGTTRELLELVTEGVEDYEFLNWKKQVFGVEGNGGSCAYSNSYIQEGAVVSERSYIEDSYLYGNTRIEEQCVISGVTLKDKQVPAGVTLHGLKLRNGKFVVRIYGTFDNPKGFLRDCAPVLGTTMDRLVTKLKLTEEELWGTQEPYLWFAKLYPVCDSIEEAVCEALQLYEVLNGRAEVSGDYQTRERMSLFESFNEADTTQMIAWQANLENKIRVSRCLKAIEERRTIEEARHMAFGHKKVTDKQLKMLRDIAETAEFGTRMRIYYYLSKMTENALSEELENECFSYICKTLYDAVVSGLDCEKEYHITKEKVTVELPVRVNFGGGWSDTPPYCNEHGGTVLNAAVSLNGQLPIIVEVKRIDTPAVVLASTDLGAEAEFTDGAELQNCNDPFDNFALHKAALIACGIIPGEGAFDLKELTDRIGGGLYLSTAVRGIPKGSGLGTSSILAGACVKGIFEFIGKEISENELYGRVLCMEQIMSTGGGWQDQVGGLTGGIKLVHTVPGLNQEIQVDHLVIPEAAKKELQERFALIYTGQRRLARNLLREVVGGYIGSNKNSIEVLYEIQKQAVLMKFELEKGNVDAFAKLLDEHWELSKRLDGGCTNTCIDQIFFSVEDLLAAKMICGAGGGGFLQVILKKGVTKEDLRARIRSVFQESGVDVWDCELV
ncbi:MAG: L-fucokinase [Lachnospiraceae bacterium]